MSAGANAGTKKTGRTILSKALIIQEYKRRLRDNIKSLSDNFNNIISAAKISMDEASHKNPVGRMTEFCTLKDEVTARAALMMRAADELLKLTHDLKEFLILHDFNFLSHAIQDSEQKADKKMDEDVLLYDELRIDTAGLITDIDREISDHFSLKY
ncbi:unnamed protein product [Enterobius vermicularis]|uniref:Mediator of RNA polymerase II transcription subunit 22 n=1 Tax=Enterobius vermicularis TaxID=51028 RepID=A0A0N4VDT3_ENTVE|nr:unnamed protein product [Enterobius vermicularis]